MPALAMLASPCTVAHATVATASGSPGTTAPDAWPSVMSASGAAKAASPAAQAVGRVGARLVGKHQRGRGRGAGGEAHGGPRQRRQPGLEVRAGTLDRRAQLAPEALEAV